MKYKSPDGETFNLYGRVEHDMYADLVAAINIATQLQAEVKRLEAKVAWLTHQLDGARP